MNALTPKVVLETERLELCEMSAVDAELIVAVLNDPDFLRFVGDRGVKTIDDARRYIERIQASHARHGFGLWIMRRKEDAQTLGMCGLIRRDSLPDVDIGFATLPAFRKRGYTAEAAAATVAFARRVVGLSRLVAITTHDNRASIALLEKLGLQFEKTLHMPDDPEELRLFAIEWH
jgi:RimJ/RimL family protein N-acetyltransferase